MQSVRYSGTLVTFLKYFDPFNASHHSFSPTCMSALDAMHVLAGDGAFDWVKDNDYI